MHLIPRSLLLQSSVHLCFLILTLFAPLVMILGYYERRPAAHCHCKRSSQCCQLYCHSLALIPITSSSPHLPLHLIKYLSNFARGRLIPQKQSLSREAKELPTELEPKSLNEKLIEAKAVATGRTVCFRSSQEEQGRTRLNTSQ